MNSKEPVLLVILIDTTRMRWLAGGIDFQQKVLPLLVSQDGDLNGYLDASFDEQASFLRHRFCGALQRGCDRLWGLQKKACHFVFLTDDAFPEAERELTVRVAEHLVQWMTSPPVVFFTADGTPFESRPTDISLIAGEIPADFHEAFIGGLPALLDAADNPADWEEVPLPKAQT
ncbi:MAG: hypothetical protein RIK87_17525 [Fuerstiella sp.]